MATVWLMFVCLFAGIVQGYENDDYPILCSRLKPATNLQVAELAGAWVTVESLLLQEGYPYVPSSSRRKVCVRTTLGDVTDESLSMSSEIHVAGKKRRTGKTKYSVSEDYPGRWQMVSRRPTDLRSELLLLAAVPQRYMVLAFCQPAVHDSSADEGEQSRPALWIKVMSRPGSGVMSRSQMAALKHGVAELLGVKELRPVHFDTRC